ncbi:Exopolyphosphatase PRUNE1-like [Homarus americanus]|uniref:Exopolyphosphatase PRUNE1-like n=1 Tax=Homarus americanus TaxID=6706 RepID=A0A8J5N0A8_HOMAM|nr:Exopolyphosphatase PRUNE1-like [Homarus americanus]
MSSFLNYLASTKRTLASQRHMGLHVVLSNEACDLDSAVSATVYAFLLNSLQQKAYVIPMPMSVIPVLNIAREEYSLKTEVVYWLGKYEIHPDILIFRNEIDLTKQHEIGLKLTLVDHHVLPPLDAHLDPDIVFIIDHRKLERTAVSVSGGMVVEPVGSCCTLVTEQILDKDSSVLKDNTIASLLYGTIVLDTVNFNEAAKKMTPKDVRIDRVFQDLVEAKTNVSGLTSEQLLRKDVKVVSSEDFRIGIASVPMMVKDYLQRKDVGRDLSKHCCRQDYQILVILGANHTNETIYRDMAVFSTQIDLRDELVLHLCNAEDRRLQLQPMGVNILGCSTFLQGNTAASRKVILPYVKDWLAKQNI